MAEVTIWRKILNYAKNPVTPSSAGIIAIIKGVFAPFVYVPLSSFSGRLLSERIESISLFNRGSGIIIILLSLISFGLLFKKKYLSSLVPAVLSIVIIVIETYWVSVIGVRGHQFSSIYDTEMFLRSGPLIVYDLTVRGRLGNALGHLVGGYILLFFAVITGLKQMKKREESLHIIKKSGLRVFLGIALSLVIILAILYYFMITGAKPIAETHIKELIDRK